MPVRHSSLPNFRHTHIDLSHSSGWSGSPTVFPPASIYRRCTPYKHDIKPWYVPRDSVIICLIFILSASNSISAGKQTDVMSAVAALLDSSPTQPRISSSGGTLPVASSPIGRPLPPSGNTPLFPLRDARWTSDTSHEQSVLAQQSERQRLEEDLPPSSPESDDSSDEDSEDEGNGDIEGAQEEALGHADGARLAVEDTEIERKKYEHRTHERGPHPNGLSEQEIVRIHALVLVVGRRIGGLTG